MYRMAHIKLHAQASGSILFNGQSLTHALRDMYAVMTCTATAWRSGKEECLLVCHGVLLTKESTLLALCLSGTAKMQMSTKGFQMSLSTSPSSASHDMRERHGCVQCSSKSDRSPWSLSMALLIRSCTAMPCASWIDISKRAALHDIVIDQPSPKFSNCNIFSFATP